MDVLAEQKKIMIELHRRGGLYIFNVVFHEMPKILSTVDHPYGVNTND